MWSATPWYARLWERSGQQQHRSKAEVAGGIDSLSPNAWGWLSDQLLERVAEYMRAVAKKSTWPQQLEEALVHLIPKSAEGKRPIGLVASLPKRWAKVRRQPFLERRKANFTEYNSMANGKKGAKRCAWAQSIMEEAARQRGLRQGRFLSTSFKPSTTFYCLRCGKQARQTSFPWSCEKPR